MVKCEEEGVEKRQRERVGGSGHGVKGSGEAGLIWKAVGGNVEEEVDKEVEGVGGRS